MPETKVITGSALPTGNLKRKLRKYTSKGWRVVSTSGSAVLTTVVLEKD